MEVSGPTPCSKVVNFNVTGLHRVFSIQVLNISKDILNVSKDILNISKDSLGNLFQCLTTLDGKMSSRNLLVYGWGLLPLILCCVPLGSVCLCLLHPLLGSPRSLTSLTLFLLLVFADNICVLSVQTLKMLPVKKIPVNHKGTIEEMTNIKLMKIAHVQSYQDDISK